MSQTYPPHDRQLVCFEVVPVHLRPVLVALLAGATDAVASRRLNVSERTYSRRLAELLDFFESQTRFQVGVQVGLSGWTVPAPDRPSERRDTPSAPPGHRLAASVVLPVHGYKTSERVD